MGFLRFLGPCFSVSIMRQAFGHTCICITTWACAGFCIVSRLQFAPLKHLSKTELPRDARCCGQKQNQIGFLQ